MTRHYTTLLHQGLDQGLYGRIHSHPAGSSQVMQLMLQTAVFDPSMGGPVIGKAAYSAE